MNCQAYYYGGIAEVISYSSIEVESCTFYSNSAEYGGYYYYI